MTPSDTKVAEFAQLFDFFEKLASRRARKSKADALIPTEEISTAPLPQDLATVVKRLSIITPAARVSDGRASTRPRRNTIGVVDRKASTLSLRTSEQGSDDEDEVESLAKFPLARKYPFTFKLMVHKLYRKDDWAKTVKDMLMKSKNEFKSLAETEQEKEEAKVVAVEGEDSKDQNQDRSQPDNGAVKFKVEPQPRSRRNSLATGGRQRSQSVVGFRRNSIIATSPVTVTPKSPVTVTTPPQPDVRALKKRCVGRRRSMSGPVNGEDTSPLAKGLKGTWVYNSEVSSSERPTSARVPQSPPFQPPPSPTEQRAKYRPMSLTQMPLSAGFNDGTTPRRGSLAVSMHFAPPLMSISNLKKAKDGNLAARRRSGLSKGAVQLEEEEEEEEGEKRPVKRPFSG